MAGHSKFKNIMHRKGAQDARKAKIFTKIGREITVSARLGGADPNSNPRLRSALAEARANNMTNDRIKRAIDTGTGANKEDDYEEMRYEGYAPGGVAVIVETLTNNRNRTAGEVRSIFAKNGGNLGETNSVSFMFTRVGEIVYPAAAAAGDAMFEAAVEAGASDCDSSGERHIITCEMDDFAQVREGLEKKFGTADKSGFVWRPNVMTPVGEEEAVKILKLIDSLEDDDDVQAVTTNFEVSDEILEKLAAAG
jgi:YebC/PmpR family DNA-binding regulatory protein